jgi:glutathione S-transferase
MSYEIYWISGSPYAWSVLLALELKGLEYTSRLLDRGRDEHKAPQFLAINPRGKVPLLKCGETVISETPAILAYLEAKHPQPPLFGASPEETGHIWQLVSEIESYVRGPVADGVSGPIFRGQVKDGYGAAILKAARGPAHDALSWVDETLNGAAYFAGSTITAADIILLPVMQALARAAGKDVAAHLDLAILPMEETYPGIAAWLARMETLPGYGNSYPPHWRD